MTAKFDALAKKAVELGAADARLMPTDAIVFDPRSFLKCRFGCNRYGRFWTCPPNLHLSPERFMSAFERYRTALMIQSPDPEISQEVTLAIEKDAMLTEGCMFAFALVLCVQCESCAFPDPCNYPHLARPSMDAYGVDIGKTVEALGFQVTFDPDGKLLPAWYSMVLID